MTSESHYQDGDRLEQAGDVDGAVRAYRRGTDHGDSSCANALGRILAGREDIDGAERAFRAADERGDAWGAYNLGILLEWKRGDKAGAVAAWRRADERGHPTASFNLGCTARELQDEVAAERWWARAAELGDAGGAYNLGLLFQQHGDATRAVKAFSRAEELGDDKAAGNLGRALKDLGDLEGAEAACRRGDDADDKDATFELGGVLYEQGSIQESIATFQRAAAMGHQGGTQMAEMVRAEQAQAPDHVHNADRREGSASETPTTFGQSLDDVAVRCGEPYFLEYPERDYCSFLGFFTDGTCKSVSLSGGRPNQWPVDKWQYASVGLYRADGSTVTGHHVSDSGRVDFEGVVQRDGDLLLTIHSRINGNRYEATYKPWPTR